ncbi:MAG: hypothetical protein IJ537_02395 [Bacteroidaceae bacterium]|nr:hypothetical protein [Bacteroidaceae bacterium]MBQ8454181.1 hypothetical protein [Bacteroidaceae bacterium]MBQ9170168.1 hypothetical protein [Bacteroidaceae bacterium]MBQ9294410.1 hypothetical protein [Bacteroidaceae bacterium]
MERKKYTTPHMLEVRIHPSVRLMQGSPINPGGFNDFPGVDDGDDGEDADVKSYSHNIWDNEW